MFRYLSISLSISLLLIFLQSPDGCNSAKRHGITVTWQASPTPSVTYNLYRATIQGGPYVKLTSGVSGLSYFDTNVKRGTTYYYVGTSYKPTGQPPESILSNEVSATY